jgi:hypothetical protein
MSYNQELLDHLHWYTNRMGVHLLAVAPEPRYGFLEVKINNTGQFYGVVPRPRFDSKDLAKEISEKEALEQGLLIGNQFIDDFWRRMVSIARDKLARTRDPTNVRGSGSEFYNGELARFRGLKILPGNSDLDPIVELEIGGTSHFTSVATTQTLNGYTYEYSSVESHEPPLDPQERWAGKNWQHKIQHSRLANTLSIQLILYNDFEIIYVRRGKVGIAEGLLNSTVNGVVEFPLADYAHEREMFLRDPIGYTAHLETLYELHLDIDPRKIRWLACAATLDESRVSLLGMSRIETRAKELFVRAKEAAREGREVEEIMWIPRKYSLGWLSSFSISALFLSWDLPEIVLKRSISPATVKKLLNTTRKGNLASKSDEWHPLGAATMLLVLASLRPAQKPDNRDAFVETLRRVRDRLD